MKIYDADQVVVMIAGLLIDSGFADGEFCAVEQESNDFDDVVGTDGEVVRSKTNDKRATCRVVLMQTSQGNSLLSTLNNLDVNSPNGLGVGPFLVQDVQGTTLYTGDACWIAKPPDASFDRGATAREWTVRVANLKRFDGNN